MVSNSQTLTRARLQLKGETFRSSQPWCGAAKDSSSQIAESHCGVRTHQDSVLRARGSTTSSECCMMSEMTGFLSCIWQRCQGFTLLTPCIWTHSHKDNKQPRQSFNHRYSRSQKHSSDHTVLCVCVCVYVTSLEVFVIEWHLQITESIFSTPGSCISPTKDQIHLYMKLNVNDITFSSSRCNLVCPLLHFEPPTGSFVCPFSPHVNQVIWVWAAFRRP